MEKEYLIRVKVDTDKIQNAINSRIGGKVDMSYPEIIESEMGRLDHIGIEVVNVSEIIK